MQTLGLLRQQAQPFEAQQRLDMESRLFKQGLLGASQPYTSTGAMGSLFREQAQADVQRQLVAQQQALQNLLGIAGLEQGLFSLSAGMAPYAAGTSGLMASGAMTLPNLIGAGIGGLAAGYGSTLGGAGGTTT